MKLRACTSAITLLVVALLAAACGGSSTASTSTGTPADSTTSTPATTAPTGPKVVASTSWVAAYARLAGAKDITVIAPSNIQHPPDYDPKPSDLAAVAGADYILLAGFEGFADRLKAAAESSAKVETIATDYDPAKLGPEVMKLAALWGTTADAQMAVDDYTQEYNAASTALKTKLGGMSMKPVIVAQAFVANWAGFAGLDVAGTYGPKPSTPSEVATLAQLKPAYVFENVHMGGGDDVVNASGAKKVNLINFPGDDYDLMNVVNANATTMAAALGMG